MQNTSTNAAPAARNRGRRRQWLVSPAFQWKYTSLVIVGVFVVSAMMNVLLYGVISQQVRARMVQSSEVNVWENTTTMVGFSAGLALIMAVACGIVGLMVTHRISGPLEVMRGYLADLANGTWPTIRPLRKKDEFKDLYDAFRRAVDGMKQQKLVDLAAMKSMLEAAQGGTNAADDECRRALVDIAQQVNRMCDDLARTIGQVNDGDAPTRPAAPVEAMMVND